MLTQKKLDEMRINAQERARRISEEWNKTFLAQRHPDNIPQEMTNTPQQPEGVQNG